VGAHLCDKNAVTLVRFWWAL